MLFGQQRKKIVSYTCFFPIRKIFLPEAWGLLFLCKENRELIRSSARWSFISSPAEKEKPSETEGFSEIYFRFSTFLHRRREACEESFPLLSFPPPELQSSTAFRPQMKHFR